MYLVRNRPVINIDLDGPLYRFDLAFRDYAQEILDKNLPVPDRWKFWEQPGWDISLDEWLQIFGRGVVAGRIWRHGYVTEGAVRAMQRLSDDEYHLRIVTSKLGINNIHASAIGNTIKWLDEVGIPYRSISFLSYGESKVDYAANALVDDNIDNVTEWAQVQGPAFFFTQPHNQGIDPGDEFYIIRTYDWPDTERQIRRLIPNG